MALNREQRAFICNPSMLREMASMSLHDRACLIKKRYGLAISASTLAKYYHMARLSYIKCAYQYQSKASSPFKFAEA